MELKVYFVALETIENVGPIASRIEARDRDLARQLRRAASSVALNIAEGERQRAGNRRARFETAIGSANECIACLDVARALGYVAKNETLVTTQDGFDRVARTLTK